MRLTKSKKGIAWWIIGGIILAIIWLASKSIENIPEEGYEEGGPANCEPINPEPYANPPESGCFGSCPANMKRTNYCNCIDILDSEGKKIGEDCDNYCVPKTCSDEGGYTCTGSQVCAGSWKNPPDGNDQCCNEECLTPCAVGTSLSCYPLNETQELDVEGMSQGFATCSNGCPDYKYAVEGPAEPSKWCEKCSDPKGSHCCIYCPPKTIYVAGEGCKSPSCCHSCQAETGLPYNDPADELSYPDEGYSICKVECVNKDLGDGVIWKAYSVNGGNTWCSQINGGTDFEYYTQCCAYCPPETHYSPASKSCEPDSEVSEFTWELDCPYIILYWGDYENAVAYEIIPFYDEDKNKTYDGICEEDVISLETEEREYYYNLESSSCVDHYTGNVKLQLIPQYSDAMSIESYNTDWIDVSVCDLEAKPKDCEDGTLHNSCSENQPDFCDDGELVPDCPVCGCPDGYECNTTSGSCFEVFQECGNNIIEGTEECDKTNASACPGNCRLDCTCPPPVCGNNIIEGTEECDKTNASACPGNCRLDCSCPVKCDDSGTGPNGDWDKDLRCNDDDPDKDGDGIPNNGDNEEWTILGCKPVDDYGVAIDNDKDKICLGLDCNDNDNNIKVTKDDPACTRDMLCSNKEKDTITNEIEIDLGGLCRPYIKLVQPEYGVSKTDVFDLIVSTDHNSACKFSIDVSLIYNNMQSFISSSGGKTHTKTGFRLDDENTHKLYVKCDDYHWSAEESLAEFELAVDSSKPVISTYYAEPNPIIERPVETVLVVGTDDKTICKYDLLQQSYNSMTKKFPGFDTFNFSEKHTATIPLSEDTKDYTYYVACKNRAGLISDTKDIVVSVDLSQDLIVTSTTSRYTNESRIYLSVKTNKNAQCFYNNISTSITNSFGDSAYEHKKLLTQLSDGDHRYYVRCYKEGLQSPITTIIFTVDTSTVKKPWVNDTSTIDDYPEYSYYTDRLRVKWNLDEKPLSGIKHFIYMLEDSSGNIIINWTQSTEEDEWIWVDEDHNGDELNLTKGTKYFFDVVAKSNAGSSSEISKSDGVTVDPSKEPEECDDLKLNGDETSIDCGGSCPKCELNKDCLVNDDCYSGFCNSSKKCAKPSCDDGIENGNETDVDCGGSCSKCENDDECKKDSDCKSGKCDSNLKICIGVDTCANNRLDSDETDVDCGGNCAEKKDKKCDDGENCKKNSDCESGSCLNGKCVAFEKDSDNDGIPDEDDNCKYISNKGQEDTDGDGTGDACDEDNDNDGMPDDWEEKYGLDPGYNDADEDPDKDKLTNLNEYKKGTDPTNKDSDGDGVSDGDEVEKGFDPADPDSHPESNFWPIFFLIIGIIFLLAGFGYLLYKKSTKPKQKKPFTPGSPIKSTMTFRQPFSPESTSSLELRRRQAMEKIIRDRERFKEHDKAFGTFTTPPKTDIKEKLHGRLDISKPKVVKPVPKKTTTTKETTTTKKTPITKKKSVKKKEKKPRDVFEELSKVATAELKKYKKK